MHGKTSIIEHTGTGIFAGMPKEMVIGRYHSLAVFENEHTRRFTVTARTRDKTIMGLAYTDRPWMGVQFHPESILTPEGPKLLHNFVRICDEQSHPARQKSVA
jgi:anthranilate synthase component 2